MVRGSRAFAPTLRFPLHVEALEARWVPTAYTLTPVVPVVDAAMAARLSAVIQRGAAAGNQTNVFTRAGDSITFSNNFLIPLATPSMGVDLAGDGSLNDTLAYFRAGQIGGSNSFAHPSVAAVSGYKSADVLGLLPSELAVSRPAFVLVMVGTNDVAAGVPLDTFRQNLTRIAETALNMGVVPVLSTIPNSKFSAELERLQPSYNQVIEDVSEALRVPLWNYWRALQQLPNLGISADGVHPSVSPTGGGDLTEKGLQFGYNVRNLTALQTLDKLRRVLISGQSPDLPSDNQSWAPLTNALAVAAGDTTGFQVEVIDTTTRRTLFRFDPFPGFDGTVRVALADVNHDGVPDLIASVGPAGPPHVKVFDGQTGSLIASFYAFDAGLTTGLSLATGDVNRDGAADIIVCPEANAPAHVKVFSASGELLDSFLAFPSAFTGGGRVASGDVNRDGAADIIVTAGTGGQGHVMVFSGTDLGLLASFFAFGPAFAGALSVTAGDFDGDGAAEVAVAPSTAGYDPHVKVLRPLTEEVVSSFYAYDPGFRGGVQLATTGRNGHRALVTATNTAAATDIRILDAPSNGVLDAFFVYETGFRFGASLGG
ncbi:multifunctional acyl-CoA thioesterase I and protease I and lysophospholipase L1 [Gemmata sp. SH-PL17]|uniref:GDSL-type esterase/lipase family protein n=1 Tax=Gemmata sp. SH-PL17 TaxID=1630693 RepID=UPI00078C7B45|nr:GDSL-type esterase/lipase family protein [Gemmata sp. SH-PL17]AMV28098.1 multifunctional acyl-CoA thioesterase I and protease I and lysophospholipase L1 [Gemmata sp. SH-PL17]